MGVALDSDVETAFYGHDIYRVDKAYTPEVRATYEQRIPLGRIGTEDEVADAIVFLASTASRYMTGQELVVDGGLVINGTVGHALDEA